VGVVVVLVGGGFFGGGVGWGLGVGLVCGVGGWFLVWVFGGLNIIDKGSQTKVLRWAQKIKRKRKWGRFRKNAINSFPMICCKRAKLKARQRIHN